MDDNRKSLFQRTVSAIKRLHGDLTDDETRLIESLCLESRNGTPKSARAFVVKWICENSQDFGGNTIELWNLVVIGELDLANTRLNKPLIVRECRAESGMTFSRSFIPYLSLAAVELPLLNLQGARIEDDVILRGNTMGEVLGNGARVGGNVTMEESTFSSSGKDSIVSWDGAVIHGGLAFSHCKLEGQLDLTECEIQRTVDLSGSVIRSSQTALRAYSIQARANIFARSSVFSGGVEMIGARIGGNLEFDRSSVHGPSTALSLDYARIGGALHLRDGFRAIGTIDLTSSSTERNVQIRHAILRGRPLALCANGAKINGSLFLDQLRIKGLSSLVGLAVEGRIEAGEARFRGPLFDCRNLHIGGDFILFKCRFLGQFLLTSLQCRGSLRLKENRNISQTLVEASSTNVAGEIELDRNETSDTTLIADRGRCNVLSDDSESWPSVYSINGFRFEGIADRSASGVDERLGWLERSKTPSPSSFAELAHYYRSKGSEEDAVACLVAAQRARTKLSHAVSKPLRLAWDLLSGYGYRPLRLVRASALWIAISTVFFWQAHEEGAFAFESPGPFYPLLFSLDTFVPIVSLHYAENWAVASDATAWVVATRWGIVAHVVFGWVVASLFGVVVARALNRTG